MMIFCSKQRILKTTEIPSVIINHMPIDGSTDRCCIAIVTNERALLSGSDQPVQNLGRHRILCM